MPSLDVLLAFAAATIVFAAFPGPALLYTAAQTVARGRRAGFMAAFGIHLGCYAHVVAAAAGLSAVFTYVPELYTAMKLVGALYLIWLGVGMLRTKLAGADGGAIAPKSARRAFLESIVVEILNPKVAIFFIAFLPQFVDPTAALPVWVQFLVLGILVNMAFTTADIVTVLVASSVVDKLGRSGRAERVVRTIGGTILVGLGARLALSRT